MDHARIFSASQLERIFACPGSAVLSADAQRTSTQYSAWGTACHELAADALSKDDDVYFARFGDPIKADGFDFEIDDEMIECARAYTQYVRDVAADDGVILVEQRVQFDQYLGLPEQHKAYGTADAIVVKGTEMIVVDLKTGRGVEVDADCAQLKAYALGALEIAETVADIDRVRLVIVQPRAGGIKEHDLELGELLAWAQGHAQPAAQRVLDSVDRLLVEHLVPGESQCRFCPAKATCPALRDAVLETAIGSAPATVDEFEALMDTRSVHAESLQDTAEQWLSACLAHVDMIEDWCKAVRTEAERRLQAGQPVPGWKLVAGKKGPRQWSEPDLVEEMFRDTFRLPREVIYEQKLISPTAAEKLFKQGLIGDQQWARTQVAITQSTGKAHVAPAADPRPALVIRPAAEDFPVLADRPKAKRK